LHESIESSNEGVDRISGVFRSNEPVAAKTNVGDKVLTVYGNAGDLGLHSSGACARALALALASQPVKASSGVKDCLPRCQLFRVDWERGKGGLGNTRQNGGNQDGDLHFLLMARINFDKIVEVEW
jgi:hypothetical protein